MRLASRHLAPQPLLTTRELGVSAPVRRAGPTLDLLAVPLAQAVVQGRFDLDGANRGQIGRKLTEANH